MFAKPCLLEWEALVDRHINLFQLCLKTGNYGSFHAIVAHNLAEGHDHLAELTALGNGSDSGPSIDDLKRISLDSVHSSEQYFDHGVNSFASLLKKRPDPEKLERALDQLLDSTQSHNHKVVQRGREEGKDIIRRLPDDIRNRAARLFMSSFEAPITVMEVQHKAIKDVFNDIIHHPRRANNDVDRALSANRAAAHVANQWVRSVFHHGRPDDDNDDFTGDGFGMDLLTLGMSDVDESIDRLTFQKMDGGWAICNAAR